MKNAGKNKKNKTNQHSRAHSRVATLIQQFFFKKKKKNQQKKGGVIVKGKGIGLSSGYDVSTTKALVFSSYNSIFLSLSFPSS